MGSGSGIAPHTCPQCGKSCYIGNVDIQCTNVACDNFHRETAAAYERERFPLATSASFEDEDTIPGPFPGSAQLNLDLDEWSQTELIKQLGEAMEEAKKDCTPEEQAELEAWMEDLLKDYINALKDIL